MTGVGSMTHFQMELIKERTGVDIVNVPYKVETAMFQALAAGEAHLVVGSGSLKPQIDAGRVRGIATTGAKRWHIFPDVPTLQESGMANVDVGFWYGVAAPAGTSDAIVNRLHSAFIATYKLPVVTNKIRDIGGNEENTTPQQFAAQVRSNIDLWTPIARKANVKIN